jgi:outer membrane protein OmpA-like peptidoglycan-associated protein
LRQPEPPVPPFVPKTFDILFDVDQGISFRHPRILTAIVRYANEVQATEVTVQGNRAAFLLSDGKLLTESEGIAERRARQVAELLAGARVRRSLMSSGERRR